MRINKLLMGTMKTSIEIQQLADQLSSINGADDHIDYSNICEFWARDEQQAIIPETITFPEEYSGGPCLSISCTQTDLSNKEQEKIIDQWCELLPSFKNLKWLWFQSKISQKLFDAACEVSGLESLYIKWGPIQDYTPLWNLTKLNNLYIGTFTNSKSLDVFSSMKKLKWLQINNVKEVESLKPITSLTNLLGLGITGTDSKKLKVPSFKPLSTLNSLEWLHLGAVSAQDESLSAFYELKKLKFLGVAKSYSKEEFAKLSNYIGPDVCQWSQPFAKFHSSLFPCRKCNENSKVMCSGKGTRSLCPTCDSVLLAKHVYQFSTLAKGCQKGENH